MPGLVSMVCKIIEFAKRTKNAGKQQKNAHGCLKGRAAPFHAPDGARPTGQGGVFRLPATLDIPPSRQVGACKTGPRKQNGLPTG